MSTNSPIWSTAPDAVQPTYDCFVPDNLTGRKEDLVRFTVPKSALDEMFRAVIARGLEARHNGRNLEFVFNQASTAEEYDAILSPDSDLGE